LDDATISSVVNQFLFDPTDSNHIFIATTMGVSETKDGGEHWVKKMEGMKEVLMVVTLGMDPARPAILYAGTSGGVYKTIDEAGHWEKVNNGLVSPDIIKSSRALNVTSVLVDPFEPDIVYASTLAGLYKTMDGGKAWLRIGQSLQDQMLFSMILDRTKRRDLPGWPGGSQAKTAGNKDHAEYGFDLNAIPRSERQSGLFSWDERERIV
jgi:photosystem II stability/assembly factor-like uncharacterized protein